VNRSLLSFLLFLAVLAMAFAVAGWWVGPTMVSLAFDDERRNEPYYLIHLITLNETSDYFPAFAQLLREEEGQLLWRGGLGALHSGRSRDELRDVAIIEFNGGGRVVQMMTSSAYRELTDRSAPVLLGAETAPGPFARDESLVLWMFELAEETSGKALIPLADSAAIHGGQLVWSVPVDVLDGDRSWTHVLLLAFPETLAVQAWLEDPQTATDRALLRRHFVDDAMMELNSP
jgi:uncharacterized protein (DUF1330 family)